MNYLKYTQYIYVIAALFFIYKGLSTINSGTDLPYLFFIMGLGAVGMFFVRRKFVNKFANRKK